MSINEEIKNLKEAFEELSEKYTVSQLKQAAKNSIEARKAAEQSAEDEEDYIQAHSPLQGPLDYSKPWTFSRKDVEKAQDNTMKAYDRTERARKLANELPDSNADAGKLIRAAKKSVEGRTKELDNAQADVVKAHKEKDPKFYEKAGERNRAAKREDEARILANKPLRDINPKDATKLETANGNYFRENGTGPLKVPGKKDNEMNNESYQEQINTLIEAFNELSEKITDLTDDEYKKYKAAGKVRVQRGQAADKAWNEGGFEIDNHPIAAFVKYTMKKHPERVTQREKDYMETIRLNKRADHADQVYKKLKKKLHQGDDKGNDRALKESYQEQINTLIESYVVLLEEGIETEQSNKEKEVSPNKISRTKKDKDNKETEVVSVADELFPYEGSAKEQYNQKIIAKINDMIEGTATLEDLINLVRQKKVAPVKEELEEIVKEGLVLLESPEFSETADKLLGAMSAGPNNLKMTQTEKGYNIGKVKEAYEGMTISELIQEAKEKMADRCKFMEILEMFTAAISKDGYLGRNEYGKLVFKHFPGHEEAEKQKKEKAEEKAKENKESK